MPLKDVLCEAEIRLFLSCVCLLRVCVWCGQKLRFTEQQSGCVIATKTYTLLPRPRLGTTEPNRLSRPLKKKEIYGCFFGRLKCVQFLEGSITDLIEDKRHKYQLLRIIKSFFSSFLLCQIFIFSRPVMVTAQIKWQTLFLNNRANLCRQEFTNWGKAYQSQSDFQFWLAHKNEINRLTGFPE